MRAVDDGLLNNIIHKYHVLEDPDVDWRIVLKWIIKQEVWRAWTAFISEDGGKWLAVMDMLMNLH